MCRMNFQYIRIPPQGIAATKYSIPPVGYIFPTGDCAEQQRAEIWHSSRYVCSGTHHVVRELLDHAHHMSIVFLFRNEEYSEGQNAEFHMHTLKT